MSPKQEALPDDLVMVWDIDYEKEQYLNYMPIKMIYEVMMVIGKVVGISLIKLV